MRTEPALFSMLVPCLALAGCMSADSEPRTLEEPGASGRILIESPADLAGLSLEPTDAVATRYLAQLRAFVEQASSRARFVLVMESPDSDGWGGSQLYGPDGARLSAVLQLDRDETGCAAEYPGPAHQPDAFAPITVVPDETSSPRRGACPQDPERAGEEERAPAREPHGAAPPRYDPLQGNRCGSIATLHSALQLDILEPTCSVLGDERFFDPLLVRRLDEFHGAEPGMTPDQIEEAHRFFEPEGKRFDCTYVTWVATDDPAAQVRSQLEILRRIASSTNPAFDCTIGVRGNRNANGEARFSHAEHVKRVRRNADGHFEIETADGLKQGRSHADVPRNPDTNTWEFGPGRGRLKAGSNEETRQMVFDRIRFQCCRLVDAVD